MLRRRLLSSALAIAAMTGIGLLAGCVALPPPAPVALSPAAPVGAPDATHPSPPEATHPPTSGATHPAAAEATHPPTADELDEEAWAMLQARAFGSYDIYLELIAGLTGDAEGDRALLEQVATPEQVTWELDQRQQIAETGGRLDGRLQIESFAMLRDLDAMYAHVCHDVGDLRLLVAESGEVVGDGAPMRELLVGFVMVEDGRLLVSDVRQVAETERTCP